LKLKLQGKILLLTLGTVTLIFASLISFIAFKVHQATLDGTKALVEETAQSAAYAISAEIDEGLITTEALAKIISGMDRQSPNARQNLLKMIECVLEETPLAFTTWVAFEPNAFDGMDAMYIERDGFRETGRFMATLVKRGNQVQRSYDMTESMLSTEGDGDFYLLPKRSGKSEIMNPYYYNYTGQKNDEEFITSLATPIFIDGRVAGVVGMDIDLAAVQNIVKNLKIVGNGVASLYANDGTTVYHKDANLIGKNMAMRNDLENMGSIAESIKKGQFMATVGHSAALGEEAYKIYSPIKFGASTTAWSLNILVPMSHVQKAAIVMVRNMIIAAAIGMLLLAVIILWITRSIVRPINGVSKMLQQFGNLDFTKDTSLIWLERYMTKSKDEIAEMLHSMASLQSNLTAMVENLQEEAENFGSSAEALAALSEESVASMEEVKASVDQVATLSETTSAAVEETNAGVEEVSSSASSAAKSATEGAEATARTTQRSEQATQEVNIAVEEIRNIGLQSKETAASMNAVSEAVETITRFVTTIQTIADQTNLLALNAAIEAARAGDAGRGFAVVAEEVRKLAEESSKAAGEVETLISNLQSQTKNALTSMGKVDGVVEQTITRSEKAKAQLQEAMREIAQVNDIMQSIAATAQEQAASSEEMAAGIDQVTQSTVQIVQSVEAIRQSSEETAKAGEQVATESQGLSEGAERLKATMAKFKVDKRNTTKALSKIAE
jgi:methyl-accepting chemotaxis protein